MRKLRDVHTFYDPASHIWRGLPTPPLWNPDQSLGQAILGMLDRTRSKVVQICADSGVEVTGGEMYLRTVRVSQNLIKLGYGNPEDIFAMAVRNGEHSAPVLFACFALGIPVNTLDPSFQREDLGHILAIVKPKLVFCDSETLDELTAACEMTGVTPKVIVVGEKIADYTHVEDLLVPTGIEDTRSTSTTLHQHPPSSSAHLHRSLQSRLPVPLDLHRPRGQLLRLSRQRHPLRVQLPLLAVRTGPPFLAGSIAGATRIITRAPVSVQRTADIVQRYQLSVISFPPSQAWAIVNDPTTVTADSFRSLRLALCGGSVVSVSLKRAFETRFPGKVLEIAYGFSEVGYAVTSTREGFYRDGSVGFTRPGVEIKIVDENNCALGIGRDGEILVRTKLVFLEYFGNREATEEMLDGEGWLHTGDIGRFDEDGLMYVVDRKKDIIKYGNYQISPSDVEAVLQGIEGVAAACVVGIPQENGNDLATALVVPSSKTIGSEFILQETAKKLPDYKQLRGGVHFVEKIPMTPSGKILRRLAKEVIMG
ncbi:luciferin 4-monooxygenase [Culex quinquefasciatus]|uniref:Luciferin 4-monooxygenase n=1 Tax=Culex quinquefasciatus TaxID=7176 RepID=B0XD96_CULQU|nr:luciferin 4-monooxygenase [Culex quinquefasciatus]|eukprot:XP_001867618.1 luciferin 4-monooxygenase [Culex quinquefasciatus]